MLETNYRTAVLRRAKWLEWVVSGAAVSTWREVEQYTDRTDVQIEEIAEIYASALATGDTFFVNRQFCALVDHAYQTIPDNLEFQLTWLQTRQGWLWLETPWEGSIAGIIRPAVSWSVNMEASEPQVFILIPNAIKESHIWHGCFMPYFAASLKDKTTLAQALSNPVYLAKEPEDRARYEREMRCLYAMFYLMNQRLAVQIEHRTDRATRRAAEREQGVRLPPAFRIISLRRLEEDRKKYAAHAPVDWHWQWEVRGHWRNQYIPGSALRRPTYIEAYIKGPPDRPMRPESHRLFVARR